MRRWPLLACSIPFAFFVACAVNDATQFGGDGGGGSGGGTTGATGGGQTTGSGVGGGFDPVGSGGSTGSGTTCDAMPDEDKDQDGFSINQGDCNDCDANVNPNAVEVIVDPNMGQGGSGGVMEPADENCDGNVDEPPMVCDSGLAIDSADPLDAARAMGLCKMSAGNGEWGVVSAQWVLPDGSPAPNNPNYHLGHGILTAFGPNVNVQEGAAMFAVSSGTARQPTDAGYQSVGGFDKGYTSAHPQGFPKESPSCPGITTGTPHDGTAVAITIQAPSNAQGFSFDFNFYTYEWPGFVCSQYNDFFVASLNPIPMGQTDGNISFDQLGNPVSVNNAFLEVCGCTGGPPCSAGGKSFTCALGNSELQGTGFGLDTEFADHGATSWLQTAAPIGPGETFTMTWTTYDSGDGVLDSTTLVDNFQWTAEPGTTVGTNPIENPK
ncbi:MAG: choice-of-anchor L domain-containing protein [Polyangiaceae bacterium]